MNTSVCKKGRSSREVREREGEVAGDWFQKPEDKTGTSEGIS